MDPVELTAGRLHLRPWQPSDADAVLAACRDAETQRWTTVPSPYTAEHARAFVGEVSARGWAEGTDLGFAVCDRTTGAVLGAVAVRRRPAHDCWDVGFWAAPAARGRGVMTDALGALCRWAFAQLGAERVEWYAEVGNWASRRVAEKAGFTVEGVQRAGLPARDGRRHGWVGARLAADPERDTRRLPSMPELSDGVVTVRRWHPDDVDDVARACDDAATARWLGNLPSPYTRNDAEHFVLQVVPGTQAEGTAYSRAVVDAATGAVLGARCDRLAPPPAPPRHR